MSFLICSILLLKNWQNVWGRSLVGMLLGSEDFLVVPSSWLVTLYSCLEEGQFYRSHHCSTVSLLCGRLLCRQLVWQNKILYTQSSLKTATCAQPAGVPFWPSWRCLSSRGLTDGWPLSCLSVERAGPGPGGGLRCTDNRGTIRSSERQTEGVRSVGRPKRRWRDDIVGQRGAVWTRIMKDRERWKTLAEGYFLQWKDTA